MTPNSFPPIVTGMSNIDKIIKGEAFYVDKTLFIREVFQCGSEAALILRPRRWGKSTNLGILQYFLDAPLKVGGRRGEIDLEKLEEKRKFFRDKKILQEAPEFEKHLGAYTVISLSLGGFEIESKEDFWSLISQELSQLFVSFSDLRSQIDPNTVGFFDSVAQGTAGLAHLSTAIAFLSRALVQVYQRPVFLLLDEYDAPLNNIWEKVLKKKSGFEALLDTALGFLGSFYERSSKRNSHLYWAVFTGVFRILKGSVGSSMNNFREYFLTSERFPTSFGFSEAELQIIFQQRGIPLDQHPVKLEEAKYWYNGYQSSLGPVYNPWSIMSWLESGKPRCYWIALGSLEILLGASQYQSYAADLRALVLGESIQGKILMGLRVVECIPGSKILADAFWTLLVFSGYLCIEQEISFLGNEILCQLRIPNYELFSYFKTCLLRDFEHQYSFSLSQTKGLSQALLRGDLRPKTQEEPKKKLKKITLPQATFQDVS